MDDSTLTIGEVAKRAGFSLDDIRVLLDASDRGEPAHARLQELAERKLPQVEDLIRRAEGVRAWLKTATDCGCDSFDACGLFTDASPDLDGLVVHVPARPPSGARTG